MSAWDRGRVQATTGVISLGGRLSEKRLPPEKEFQSGGE